MGAESTGGGAGGGVVPLLLARLRFVRGLRERLMDELDGEELALLVSLRDAGLSWRELAEAEYGTSLNAVQQRFVRLAKRAAQSARGDAAVVEKAPGTE